MLLIIIRGRKISTYRTNKKSMILKILEMTEKHSNPATIQKSLKVYMKCLKQIENFCKKRKKTWKKEQILELCSNIITKIKTTVWTNTTEEWRWKEERISELEDGLI